LADPNSQVFQESYTNRVVVNKATKRPKTCILVKAVLHDY